MFHHARSRRLLAGVVTATLVAGVLTLLGWSPAQANHPLGSSLQVIKEINSAAINHPITLTAVLSDTALTPVDIAWEFEGGPYKPGVDSDTADEICTIPATGTECTISVTSASSGTGLVRAWIDHDKKEGSEVGGINESDGGEGRLANASPYDPIINPGADCLYPSDNRDTRFDTCSAGTEQPGTNADEPDNTDVVQVTWTDSPSQIDCFDSNPNNGTDVEINRVDQDEVITCRASDSSGRPAGGVAIDGENLNGVNDPDSSEAAGTPDYDWTVSDPPQLSDKDTGCETDSGTGECSITLAALGQSSNSVFAKVCFWLDTDVVSSPPSPPPSVNGNHVFDEAGAVADGGDCDVEKAASGEDTDATDVVSVQWRSASDTPAASAVDVNPETATSTVGSPAALTATVYDQYGDKLTTGANVISELFAGSPGDTDGNNFSTIDASCTTGATGSCTFNYSSATAGTARACTFLNPPPSMTGDHNNGTCGGEDLADGLLDKQDVTRILWTASSTPPTTTTIPTAEDVAKTQGYSLVGADGGIFNYGTSSFKGSMGDKKLNQPVIGMANKKGGTGYWLVAKDGGIFTFGDADFFGSMGDQKLNAPILGMEATPSGKGYFLFAADGGIFTFGDAQFVGSTGDMKLNAPVVGMAIDEKGDGYWLVAQDGGIFTFGKAPFYGSTGDKKLNQPVFDMASTAGDKGYWLVAKDGGIFSFGDAENKFAGSAVGSTTGVVIGMGATPTSNGYWIADNKGAVFPFGDAKFLGDRRNDSNNAATVGFATVPKA
jgi:hypothetical protein